ncbi:MAG: hypothetical protein U0457_01920 [Candidatus Sericytochromatia bacterium]
MQVDSVSGSSGVSGSSSSDSSNLTQISASSIEELFATLKSDPQFKDIVAQLEAQYGSSLPKYSSTPSNGLKQVNLQSQTLTDWTGLQAVYTNSQQFYGLMDTLFTSQENSDDGSGVDQIDFSTLLERDYGPVTSLASAIQGK